ncbi:MAG: hypothetical protein ABJB09_05485 [Verrucomicrobiota bacterium]
MSKISANQENKRILDILHKWGIHTVGQLAALPQAEVAARLGPVGRQFWERARGENKRLLKLIPPPQSFAEAFEFENEIETAEPLLFMLRRFLQQLTQRLEALYLVASELRLEITFSDKHSYEHLFTIPEPTNQIDVLFRILHTHLESFTAAAPITAIALRAEPARPSTQQFHLFETALRDPTRLSETLARLTGLLGPDRVGTPVLEETHRPDAFRMEKFVWQVEKEEAETAPWRGCALRRFRSPTPVAMTLRKKRPAHLRSAEVTGQVVRRHGPYQSSGNWWDKKAWQRAEWDLELEQGVLCQSHSHAGQWALDGIYD